MRLVLTKNGENETGQIALVNVTDNGQFEFDSKLVSIGMVRLHLL